MEDPSLDSVFSTGYDVILSRFISGFLISEFIDKRLQGSSSRKLSSTITWTSKKVHLVELIYALHKAGVFNNGKAELKEVATVFESAFNISLEYLYRKFQEISLRKIHRTVFIDMLKEKLEERLDESA
jgi:hypothetical protein